MQRQVASPVRRGAVGKVAARPTRWPPTLLDATFFLDLPSAAEKGVIWEMYLKMYGLDRDQRRPRDTDFTGAEIKSCCRLAALLDLPLVEAAHNIVPVAVTAGEAVERLRNWASGRCLAADRPGIYTRGTDVASPSNRRINRDPSAN